MTSEVHISVIRGWLFVDDDSDVAVIEDLTAYRAHIAELHGGNTSTGPWRLPWPPFPSHFWKHHFGATDYENTPPHTLVGALLPRRVMLDLDYRHEWRRRRPLGEVFLEPFGLWTTVTVDLTGGAWATDEDGASALSSAFGHDLLLGGSPAGQLNDGIGLDALAQALVPLPWGQGVEPREIGTLTLISGACPPGGDPGVMANMLRTRFLGGANATVQPHTMSAGASATTSRQVGLALAFGPKVGARVKCLHHNHALLLGHLQSFGAVASTSAPAQVARYQALAAHQLNHLYRGEPVFAQGIYKSRVAPAWIDKQGLNDRINTLNATSNDGAALPRI